MIQTVWQCPARERLEGAGGITSVWSIGRAVKGTYQATAKWLVLFIHEHRLG